MTFTVEYRDTTIVNDDDREPVTFTMNDLEIFKLHQHNYDLRIDTSNHHYSNYRHHELTMRKLGSPLLCASEADVTHWHVTLE